MVRFASSIAAVLVTGLSINMSARADVPADLELKLGTTTSYMFQVSSSEAETIKLSIDRAELDKVAGSAKVAINLNPAVIALKPNTPVTVEFKVTVPTDSPSFGAVKIGVNSATETNGLINIGETMIMVKPVYEILLKENDEWSLPKTASFIPHKDGLTVRFLNMDKKKSHTIHSSGAIPHQSGSLSPANDEGPVGSYDHVIKAANVASKAGVYCHDHEGFSNQRVLTFNVQPR